MKEKETYPGKTYSVHSSSGCTVSDDSGWSKTLEAPEDYFTAHSGKVYVSDDSASVRELFKLAPQQQLALLGVLGGDKLPAGYTRLAYLEGTGTQYCKLPTDVGREAFRAETDIEFTAEEALQIMGFSTYARYYWGVNAIGQYTIGGDALIRDTPSNVRRLVVYENENYEARLEAGGKNVTRYNADPLKARSEYGVLYPADTHTPVAFCQAKIFGLKFFKSKKLFTKLLPCIDATGTPCMYDLVSSTPFYNNGTGAYIAGIETQGQFNNMLRNLPDRTGLTVGTLQVRLADNLQTVENEAKLDAMLAKNWEITQAA